MRRHDLRGHLVEVLTEQPDATTSQLIEFARTLDPLLSLDAVADAVAAVRQWAGGLGPIADLLADDTVTELAVNGPGPVWVERNGRLSPTSVELTTSDLELLVERIVDPLGLRVDRTSPLLDARLPDGSRVNVVLPPLAVDGPLVTVRRFARDGLELEAFGPASLVSELVALVRCRATIVVVGATSAGKTTLLNALASHIDPGERIVTIEDTAELALPGAHVVRLEARPANAEGVGEVGLRALVRNALRMRPDRLVVGEVRGAEALDLLLALTSGHRGSLTTCHAADAVGALRRLELLALLGGVGVAPAAIRGQLAAAVDAVVVVARHHGKRFVQEISLVEGSERPVLVPAWRSDEDGSTR